MQVEADVRSCTYIAGGPKSAWSEEGPDSPLSDTGIWEDAGAQEVGVIDKGGQCPPAIAFVYSEPALTGSEAEAGQVSSAREEVTPTSSSSPEASDERGKPWSPEGGGLPSGRQTPTRTCHSWSVSEQEAKGARTQSQKIAAQLTTPPSPNSKGVLLFNRRKKRVNEFTQRGLGAARLADGDGGEPRGCVGQEPREEPGLPYFEQQAGMEEEETHLEGVVETKAGGEDQQAITWPDSTEDYMELPAETRRREAEAFRPSGLAPPPPMARPGKTGLLEQSRLRAAGRKPMFTFHERPRLAPNPELLSLVHGADVQRKGGGSTDDSLGLGAEACMLAPCQAPAPAPAAMVCAGEEKPAPEWASCLKPPELRPPRRAGASQCLAEVRGKGAELFARRQTRMERFTIEAPLASERQPRPTSPTASLPPSWRCGGNLGPSYRPLGVVGGISRPSGLVGGGSSAFHGKTAVPPGLRQLGLGSPLPVHGAPRPKPTRTSPLPPPTAAKPPGPRLNSLDTRPVLTTQGPSQAVPWPTETLQAIPRPTETLQAVPRPTETLEAVPRPTETLQAVPRPTETLQAVPRPTETLQAVPRPTETLQAVPRPTETLQAVPRPTETLQAVPRPTETLQAVPRPTETLQAVPRPTETLQAVPRPTETLQAVPRPTETLQAIPRPTEMPQAPKPNETPQTPRPTFSARRAGLEAQGGKSSVTPPWKTAGEGRRNSTRMYLDTVQSDSASSTALGSPQSPLCTLSPTAGVLSPSSWTPPRSSPATKLGSEITDSRRLKDLLAKNVVSAARRKKLSSPSLSPSSPGDLQFPLSPRSDCLSPLSPSTPTPATLARSPIRVYRRSLTDSEFSLGSDDSGARSPSYHNFCPRGWTGSRVKQSEQ
ncbi:synaptopodin-2 [Narcine bancroftii]|uniref:synaptopodin-2 n=1 Tax=Narcine bancroftii TaxID=1343680 RepID=UPI00383123D8